MAAQTEIVRISYQDLENIAQKKEESDERNQSRQNTKGEIKHHKHSRQKRPTRGIYQPPSILRHKQQQSQGEEWNGDSEGGHEGENWGDELEVDSHGSTSSSKENSVEKEVDAVLTSVRNIQLQSHGGSSQQQDDKKFDGEFKRDRTSPIKKGGSSQIDSSSKKRPSKRPEIQRYVPKGKILHSQGVQETESWDEDDHAEQTDEAAFSPSPRKVDIQKSDKLNMKVTVTNDVKGIKASQEAQETKTHSVESEKVTDADQKSKVNEPHDKPHQYKGSKNRPSWDRPSGNKKFGQENRRPGFGPKGQGNQGEGWVEKPSTRQNRRGENWEEQYGTWPREKERTKTSKKPGPHKKEEGWDEMSASVSHVEIEPMGTENPKPQRTQQRKPRGSAKTGKQTVEVTNDEIDADNNVIPTMIFERQDIGSSATDNATGSNLKQKPPKGQSSGKSNLSKRYSLSALRRPRAGSVSSDVSTASDLSIDEETTSKILDWDKEVEREMAQQVQDETLKLKEFLEKQGDFPGWQFDTESENKEQKSSGHTEHMDQTKYSSSHASEKAYRPSRAKENQFAGRKKHNSGSHDRHYDDGSDRWYGNENNRSRRTDRRRNSSNGRRSRDSSVSSVHSVQSYHGDDNIYHTWSLPRKGRRRRRSSNTSLHDRSSSQELLNDPVSPNLKVTFAQHNQKRQVTVQNQNESGSHSNQGHRGRGRGRTRSADRSGDSFIDDKSSERGNQRTYRRTGSDLDTGNRGDLGYKGREHHQSYEHISGGRGRGRGRDRNMDHYSDQKAGYGRGQNRKFDNRRERRHSDRESPMHESGTPPHHSGGIIKLPPSSSYMTDHPDNGHHRSNEGVSNRDDSKGRNFRDKRGGGAGQRKLYDPKNPNKPIMIKDNNTDNSGALKFQETGHDIGQGAPLTPPTPPPGMYHPGYPPGYYGNYEQRFTESGYPMPPPPPPHPGYYGYPFPQAMPSGAYRDNAMYHEEMYHRDSYYHSEYDHDQTVSGRSRTQCRSMAERMFQEALPLDSHITHLVSRRISGKDLLIMHQLRHDLQNKYEQIVLLDLDVANKHNIEQLLWKSIYYQVIEVFRKNLAEEKDDDTKTQLTKILNEGTDFYERLLQKLQQTYNFQLDVFLDSNSLPPDNINRTVKLALLSVQRSLICLGDISRYREQNNDSGKVNYGRARSWYTKAQQIAPKNGRPYNQLAILALYTRRKLDAVYYYMRSLAASNPFLTARESLMSLFDEARKKAENSEKKREQEKEKTMKLKQQKLKHGERMEIWVSPDGSSTKHDDEEEKEEDQMCKLDAVEINKRFVLSFLNVHGKLFTKIGRETFPECCGQMLKEFQALLKHGAIGPTRLLQLMAINMFAIENTALKQEYSDNFRSELQEHAVQLGLDMFGLLVCRCSEQLSEHLKSKDYPAHMFSRALEELVPGMKVWVDWMFCHSSLWNPPPQIRDTSIGPDVDVWQALSELCSILKDVDTSHVKLYKDKREGCDPVILSEDVMLAGFVPLLSLPQEVPYVHSTVDKEIAQDCSRINKLKDFGDYLCGIDTPVLAFDVAEQKFYSVAPSTGYSEEEKGDFPSDDNTSGDEDVVIESETEELNEADGSNEHVQQLRVKKEELKRKKKEQEKQQENIQKILDKNKHRCIELEIHPIFLVPDTNCFIDHLSSLQKLIETQKFTVTIPLIVINELDGLAKGSKEGQYDSKEHANKVKTKARETIQFLEQEFEKKNNHLRAQTGKGNVLETIAFRSEESEADSGNNDDVILSCCLHYCKDKAREFMHKDKDAAVRLYRDVVLLTDDRNLCLKAHTCNVPVKDLPSFMKWSKIT